MYILFQQGFLDQSFRLELFKILQICEENHRVILQISTIIHSIDYNIFLVFLLYLYQILFYIIKLNLSFSKFFSMNLKNIQGHLCLDLIIQVFSENDLKVHLCMMQFLQNR